MGIFDGYLICSDWDGTLFSDHLNQKDIKAIRYFQENGGKFTICSGRYFSFLKKFENEIKPNTYIITLNGAKIVDENGDTASEGYLDSYAVEILDKLILKEEKCFSGLNLFFTENELPADISADEYKTFREKIKNEKLYKVVLRGVNPKLTDKALKEIKQEIDLKDYIVVKSWDTGLEVLKKDNAKGSAARKIANKIDAKVLICVGDYDNDLTMIEEADIGYAVGNALQSVKDIADRITVSQSECAIAKVIEDLEKEISSKM